MGTELSIALIPLLGRYSHDAVRSEINVSVSDGKAICRNEDTCISTVALTLAFMLCLRIAN